MPASNIKLMPLAEETMSCATSGCEGAACVALVRRDEKVVVLACDHCAWLALRKARDAENAVARPEGSVEPAELVIMTRRSS